MMSSICCFFNYNPLYRYPIYQAMGERYDIDFFFGDTVFEPIKQFDASTLTGFKSFLKAKKVLHGSFVRHTPAKELFADNYKIYVITGDSSSVLNWRILLHAKIHKKRVYAWTHGVKDIEAQNWKGRLLNKMFFKGMTGVLLYNRYTCQNMLLLGCNKSQLRVIHNSLDTKVQTLQYEEMRSTNVYSSHFENNYPTVIYIGRIQKRKRLDQLIKAISILKKESFHVNLVIVGKETDDHSITETIKHYGLTDCVWMYGPCYEEAKNAELLYNAAVCVCPAEVGLTCIHSLSYGTPVVSNDNFPKQMPEFEAITDGLTGSFFKENDVVDLAKNIRFWCSRCVEDRQTTRNAARQTVVNEWSIDYQLKVLDEILK